MTLAAQTTPSISVPADVYRAKEDRVAYIRQAGFSGLQNEQIILSSVQQHGRIRRNDVVDLCHLAPDQAYRLLIRLKLEGKLTQHGERRCTFYTLGAKELLS